MKALVIVDMINAFVESKTKDGPCALYMPKAKALIPEINKVIKTLDKDDIIIHIQDRHAKNDEEFELFPPHAIMGTEEAEVADGFDWGDKDPIIKYKTRFSGFYRTDLHKIMMHYLIEDVIIVGVATDICILHTAAGAVMRDYKVTVKKACITGIFDEDAALEHMKKVLSVNIE